jgi:tetratricopeptide (TPR) repeat protein
MNSVNFKSQTAVVKYPIFSFLIFNFALLLSGCASFEAGSNVQRGRYALMRGDAKLAVSLFQRATEIDSNYTMYLGPMKEGVWTYLGRAHYDSGDFKSALKALEQARTSHPDDSFAPLYLGLALAKDGDRQRGVKELHAGLTGLNSWLDYINQYSADRVYWDPGDKIGSRIKQELARIDGKEFNWNDLIAGAEQVGTDLESEPDEVRKEKRRDKSDSARGDDKGD